MKLVDKLKRALAVAQMQNSPIAAVPIEDLKAAIEELSLDPPASLSEAGLSDGGVD